MRGGEREEGGWGVEGECGLLHCRSLCVWELDKLSEYTPLYCRLTLCKICPHSSQLHFYCTSVSSLSYTHLHFLVISKCESCLSETAAAEGSVQNYTVITHLNLKKLSSQVTLSNLVSSWTAVIVRWNHLVLTAFLWLTSVTGDFLISLHDKSLLTDRGSSNLSSILVFENNQQNAFRLNYLATIKSHIFCPDVLLLAKQALGSTFARN